MTEQKGAEEAARPAAVAEFPDDDVIAERGRAEAALWASEARYRLIAENSTDMITLSTPEGLLYVSPACRTLLGYEPEEVVGQSGLEAIHPEDRHVVAESYAAILRSSDPVTVAYRIRRKDGTYTWLESTGRSIRDPATGRVTGHIAFSRDVSERKRGEEALRESEARYRLLAENSSDMIARLTPDAVVRYVSPACRTMLGFDPDELVGRAGLDLIHPDDLPEVTNVLGALLTSPDPVTVTHRSPRKDGTYAWFEASARAVRDQVTGAVGEIVVVSRDVTERKRAEEALHESEERFRKVFEEAPIGMVMIGPSGILRMNAALCRMLGYTEEELSGRTFFDMTHPEDRELGGQLGRKVFRGEVPSGQIEKRYIAKNGDLVWARVTAGLIRDQEGSPLYNLVIVEDITDRKRVEEALRASEERARSIVETAGDAFVAMDADGAITDWNAAAERLFGWSGEEIVGRRAAETIIPPKYHDAHRAALLALRDTGEGLVRQSPLEFTVLHRDGREIPVEVTSWEGAQPGHRKVNAFVRDITQRRAAEEATQAAYKREQEAAAQLRAVDEMKNAFLAAVSHDLRTPLAAILSFAETLELGGPRLTTEQVAHIAGAIVSNAKTLSRLVTDLLDLDRLTRGVLEPHRRPTDLAALVRETAESLDLGQHDVRVEVEGTVVDVDPAQVERIVENLLANAAKHTPPGTPVWVRGHREAAGVLLAVEDAGPGVPDELKEAIFEHFRRGDMAEHVPGAGVGLSVVARFAALHGGRAWVEDRPGGGASFRVFLPDPDAQGEPGR